MKLEYTSELFSRSAFETILAFSKKFEVFSVLNSNTNTEEYQWLAAFGVKDIINDYQQIDLNDKRWKFGYISYDVKNKIEHLSSNNYDRIGADDFFFFVPEIIITCKGNTIEIEAGGNEESVYRQLQELSYFDEESASTIQLKESISEQVYLDKVSFIKEKISKGDIYEMNFCMEFFAEDVQLNASQVYTDLNAISEAPFSFFCRFGNVFTIGSSPERFLKKQGTKLITQPIKGTAPRFADVSMDLQVKRELGLNEKERNENVMIVDVARNDLSRIAKRGSVQVAELFGVYSFKQVHQMISTVTCDVDPNIDFKSIINASFPPASMTGAPKIRAMQIIEECESFKRGIYSGVLGYISPAGNFDFNVVIRTILYNAQRNTVSYAVGSAITDKCNAADEYAECLLKANAMRKVLEK